MGPVQSPTTEDVGAPAEPDGGQASGKQQRRRRNLLRSAARMVMLALLTIGVVGTLVVAAIDLLVAHDPGGPGQEAGAIAVEATPVERQTIREIRTFSGTLQPYSRSLIGTRVGGQVQAVHVNIGDRVENGAVIAMLDDDEFRQEVDQANADLEVARAHLAESQSNLDTTERELQRVESLHEREIASESELDAVRADHAAKIVQVRVSESQLARAEAQVRAAEVRLSYTEIRASYSNPGIRVIGERFVDEGSTLAANDPVVSLLNIDRLYAIVHVPERDYTRLGLNQEAHVLSDSYPDTVFNGQIAHLSPEFQETSRQARVEIQLDNPDHKLRPGMFVQVQVELDRADDVPVVPRTALVEREGRAGLFVIAEDGETVSFVAVTTGIQEGELLQVVEPALAGHVVTLGQNLLDDGVEVRVQQPDAPKVD